MGKDKRKGRAKFTDGPPKAALAMLYNGEHPQ
jgi:hypothetical protein